MENRSLSKSDGMINNSRRGCNQKNDITHFRIIIFVTELEETCEGRASETVLSLPSHGQMVQQAGIGM